MDTRHGLRGGIATTDDFEKFEIQSRSVPDNRNMAGLMWSACVIYMYKFSIDMYIPQV